MNEEQTYLSIVADQVHPIMETVFPNDSALFQQDSMPCHTTKMVQQHNKGSRVVSWPQHSPDLNPIEHLWDVLDKQVQFIEAS